ncbi:MAG: signal peptidase II [Salibacteraceae bacterium]
MKKNIILVAVIVTIILLFDQILKIYIKSTFDYDETHALLGDWFVLEYIENQGMAFGTTFGSSIWAKLALSVFRIIAISGIIYYLILQLKKGVRREFLIAISLILAGATGNLIDSMFYDFIFPVDEYLNCGLEYNRLDGSGNWVECAKTYEGQVEIRHTGFLFGNVVDMFQFQATWPTWVPWLGGGQVFPAIWNVADAAISLGVIMVFFRQRKYFPKEETQKKKKLAFSMPWNKKSEVPVTEPEVKPSPEEGSDSVKGEEREANDSAL